MIKVSVIIPAYNVEKYIDRCMDSLIQQTLKEVEFIVINDGSTDATLEKINEYLPNEKIKVFNRENHGIGNTRNFGLQQAVGEYVGFVDSDDFIEETMLELLYNKAKGENLDIAICDFYRDFEESKNCIVDHIKGFENAVVNLKSSPELLNQINLSPWNKLYKKTMIDTSIQNFEETLKYEDVPFVIRILTKASRIGKVNVPLYHYMIHKNSETTVMDERVFDLLKIFDKVMQEHKNKIYLKEELDYLIVQRLSDYNIQQRNQKDRKVRNKFIDETFTYMKKYIPNYKKNRYYKKISLFKRIIEKNKIITKIYCSLYVFLHRK